MHKDSLKINMSLNVIRSVVGILTPLITFPYVTRILKVDGIGSVTFANSIVAYFIMIADLGIKMYAIGHAPAYKSNIAQMRSFVNSIFSINIISTLFSYLLLFTIVYLTPQLREHSVLILILSGQIFLNTIGVEWLIIVYEDFKFVTIRTIAVNICFIINLLVFVRNAEDLLLYAFLLVFANGCMNVSNLLHSRKYCKFSLTKSLNFNKHLKPILLLFLTQATILVYVSSDTTILGLICGSYYVGIYAVAAKLYTVLKSVIAAVIAAAIPRMSATFGQNDDRAFSKIGEEAYLTMCTIVVPIIVGTIVLAPSIVDILAGKDYADAVLSVRILSISLFFCIGAYFWGQAVLIPVGKESLLFRITLLSAFFNVLFNLLLIPIWTFNAAAATTLLSEALTYFFCRFYGRKFINFPQEYSVIFKSVIGSIFILLIAFILSLFNLPILVYLILTVIFSIILYFYVEYFLHNEIIFKLVNNMKLTFGKWM